MDLLAGLRYVGRHPRLRVLVPFFISVVAVGFPHVTVLPGLVKNELGHEVESISVLYLVSAAGALASSLSVARFADSPRATPLFTAMGFVFGVALLGLAAVPSYEMALLAMFVIGVGSGGFQSLNGAVIARESEPVYMGRVVSLTLLAFGLFGLMALPVGLLADAVGERAALAANGIGVCVCVAVAWLVLTRQGKAEDVPQTSA